MKKRTKKQSNSQVVDFSKNQTKTRDINSKTIFHDPMLCAQFLIDNLDIPMLREIQPEDIETVRSCIEKNQAKYYDIVPLPCQINPKRNRFC